MFIEDINSYDIKGNKLVKSKKSDDVATYSSVLVDEAPKIVVKGSIALHASRVSIEDEISENDTNHVSTSLNDIEGAVVGKAKKSSKKVATKVATDKNEDGYIDMSIKELREVANKVISGEISREELNLNVRGEVGELLRLIVDTKAKVDDINPALNDSKNTLPELKKALNEVTLSTDNASINLMESSEIMCDYYKSLTSDIDKLVATIDTADKDAFLAEFAKVEAKLKEASEFGFKILEALEYQDITEQKIRKVVKAMNDIGSRLGTIVGYLHIQKSEGKSPKEIEKLLSDYGLS